MKIEEMKINNNKINNNNNINNIEEIYTDKIYDNKDINDNEDINDDEIEIEKTKDYVLNDKYNNFRLDLFLSKINENSSRSFYSKLIKGGMVKVNNKIIKKPSFLLSKNDVIELNIPSLKEKKIEPENIPIDILYEDDDILIVNKPKEMVVHPSFGHYSGTLVNALLYHSDKLSNINGPLRPGIVHRIDMNTTGSLIICKNNLSHENIAKQLKNHSINRVYIGIVHGNIKEDKGTIDANIGRSKIDRKKMAVVGKNSGKKAITHFSVIKRSGEFTYCSFILETGRTHQIRVHMASIGHPLLGDNVYGPKKCPFKNLIGQTLHAYKIEFIHPSLNQYMEFEAPIPEYFNRLLECLFK